MIAGVSAVTSGNIPIGPGLTFSGTREMLSKTASICLSIVLAMSWLSLANCVQAQQTATYDAARLVSVHNTLVSSEAPGIIRTIEIEAGAEVDEHATLVVLNAETFKADYEVALAEEEIAKLQAENRVKVLYAQKTAEVTEKTLAKSVDANVQFARTIPSTEIEKLQLQLDQAILSGEQAQMEFDVAQWTSRLKQKVVAASRIKLDSRTIRSPLAGTIAQVLVQPGQWVNAGEPIVRVLDLDHLRVEGYFSQDLIRHIRPGTTGSFIYTLGGEVTRVPVRVSFVSPEIVEGIFQVRADVDNRNRAYVPGTTGKLTLDLRN